VMTNGPSLRTAMTKLKARVIAEGAVR